MKITEDNMGVLIYLSMGSSYELAISRDIGIPMANVIDCLAWLKKKGLVEMVGDWWAITEKGLEEIEKRI